MATLETFFDDDGKQLRPLPARWIKLSRRFRVGQRVRYLRDRKVYVGPQRPGAPASRAALDAPENWREMRGAVGEIVRVNDGHSCYPSRWHADDSEEGGTWLTDARGWLTVRFPDGAGYGFEADGVTPKPIACHPDEEGTDWEIVE